MTFLEAVVEISKRDDIELCDAEDELTGIRGGICVYQTVNGVEGFIGKLYWPSDGKSAEVQDNVIFALTNPTEDARADIDRAKTVAPVA